MPSRDAYTLVLPPRSQGQVCRQRHPGFQVHTASNLALPWSGAMSDSWHPPSAGPTHCPANLACSFSHSRLWISPQGITRVSLIILRKRFDLYFPETGTLDRNCLNSRLASWELIASGCRIPAESYTLSVLTALFLPQKPASSLTPFSSTSPSSGFSIPP